MRAYRKMCLKMPMPREHALQRERLLSKLYEARNKRLIMIEGGAGVGKTTLVTTFLQKYQLPYHWLTMQQDMNDLFIFIAYLIEGCSMEQLHKQELMSYVDAAAQSNQAELVIEAICDVFSHSKPFTMVIDDAHRIQDDRILTLIEQLMEEYHQKFLFIGRTALNIYCKDAILNDDIFLLHGDELMLNQEEAFTFLKETLQFQRSQEALLSLCEWARGWIGGLQLLTIALQQDGDIESWKTGMQDTMLQAYIQREIYDTLPLDMQMFLCKTSILQSFDEEFILSYLPQVSFPLMMKRLQQLNFIVTTLEDGYYCYHDIMKEFLLEQFQELRWNEQKTAHANAARIFYAQGDVGQALHHCFEIKDYDTAMKWISENVKTSQLLSYMKRIPLKEIVKNPDFAYQLFFYSYANVDEARCYEIFHLIHECLKEDVTFQAFEYSHLFMDSYAKANQVTVLPIETISSLPLSKETISFLVAKDAFFLYAQGNYPQCLKRLAWARSFFEESANMYVGAMLYMSETQIYEQLGYFQKALRDYESLNELEGVTSLFDVIYDLGIAGIYMKQFHFDQAQHHLDACMKTFARKKVKGADRSGRYTLAQLYFIMGDVSIAKQCLQEVMQQENFQDPITAAPLLRLFYVYEPDHPLFEVFEKQMKQHVLDLDFDSHILLANLYEKTDMELAMKLIDEILIKARKLHNPYALIDACIQKVHLVLHTSKETRVIHDLLCEALSYAVYDEVRLPFFYLRKDVNYLEKDLLSDVKRSISPQAYQFLLDVLCIRNEDSLSAREIEVMEEIIQGYTNKEIAQHLCISQATVKTHLINIYKKLDVTNRIEAMRAYQKT